MQSPVFVGRREEIASLTALLERAADGEPGFAIVAGEAGVGKTRLVTELAGQAAGSGFTVLASRVGVAPIAAEATALARRTRLSLDDPAADAVVPAAEDPLARFGLTEREREILVLLAAGRSNPQIAESLFISPKTASVHVSNILAKLGVDSRVEAAAVAHRLGVTG
jgi:DNA-binding NarL/FixJ family response regulator